VTTENLSALRAAVLRDDPQSVAMIRRELHDNSTEPGRRLDLLLLLTETHQRHPGQIVDALTALVEARATASSLGLPGTDPWQTVMLAVSADLAVWEGHVDAVQACTRYAEHARDVAQDLVRLAHAAALRAVAVYHRRSCVEGRERLGVLRDRVLDAAAADLAALGPMVQRAHAAADEGCRPSCAPPIVPVPALPGGVLHPDTDDPDPGYLASRIWRYPPVHTCDAWAVPRR
jgi:hypothetical protein